MTDPLSFQSTTPRYSLPNLFSGQSQKEVYVNEAFARLDFLLHPAVQEEIATPPASPVDGQTWLVAAGATGDWSGHDGDLASWQAGSWAFASPTAGMRIVDLSTGGALYYDGSWQRIATPAEPTGGTKPDAEARAAIVNLIETLRIAGIFPST